MTFKTVKRPEWINLFDAFRDREYDDSITYPEMNKLLFDGDVRTNKRYVFERFEREMLEQELKALENVRSKGYRIVKANEQLRLAHRQLTKARKSIGVGIRINTFTNEDLLSEREKALRNLAATRLGGLYASTVGEQKAMSVEKKKIAPPEVPRPKFQSP